MRVSLAILSAVLAFIQAHLVAAQANSSMTDTAAVVTVTTAAVISSSMILPPLQSSVTLSEILTAPSRPSAMPSVSFPAATQEFPSHPTVGSSSAQKTGTPSSPDENAGTAVASSNRWLFAGCALVVVGLTNAVVL